jgi:hypothetical protein
MPTLSSYGASVTSLAGARFAPRNMEPYVADLHAEAELYKVLTIRRGCLREVHN